MKKFKMIGCCAALAALVGANVWNATTNLKAAELNLSGIENIAEGEQPTFWQRLIGKKYYDESYDCATEGYRVVYVDGTITTTEDVKYINVNIHGGIRQIEHFQTYNRKGHNCPTGNEYCNEVSCFN